MPDGSVTSMVRDTLRNRLYIAGDFNYLGAFTGSGALIDTTTKKVNIEFPKPRNGAINKVIADGYGGWFISGEFTFVGDSARNRLAHIDSLGNVTAWNPGSNGAVYTMVLDSNKLYVGGGFTNIGGVGRNRIALVDALTGKVDSAWNPNANRAVRVIVIQNNLLYAGGQFDSIGGQRRECIASIDKITGQVTSWNVSLIFGGISQSGEGVRSIALSGDKMYLGGSFTAVQGILRSHIARINKNTGTLDTSWGNDHFQYSPGGGFLTGSGMVFSIVVHGDRLFIGNNFSSTLYVLDTTSYFLYNAVKNSFSGSDVYDIKVVGNRFFIASGNKILIRDTSRLLSYRIVEEYSFYKQGVFSFATWNDKLYAGGDFLYYGGKEFNGLAAIDENTGIPINWNPNGYDINVMTIVHDKLYIGGRFSSVAGQTRNGIAAFNLQTGALTSFQLNFAHFVSDIQAFGNKLYLCGHFSSMAFFRKFGSFGLQVVSCDTNGLIDTLWLPDIPYSSAWTNDRVNTIAPSGNKLYLGGTFTTIQGQTRYGLASVDLNTGLLTTWQPTQQRTTINRLYKWNNRLYVGGVNSQSPSTGLLFYGNNRNRLAAFDIQTDSLLSWSPNINRYTFNVEHMVGIGSKLYVNGDSDSGIYVIDTVTAACTPFYPISTTKGYGSNGYLVATDNDLYSGGYISGKCYGLLPFTNLNYHLLKATICKGGSYSFNGDLLTQTGTYSDTLINANGGDSILVLKLKVQERSSDTLTLISCDSFLFNGRILYQSGTYIDTIPSSVGCDSIITLHLNIKHSSTFTITDTACGSYMFGNSPVSISGSYKRVFINSQGCDSLVFLNIHIKKPSASTLTVAGCNSYSFNGKTYAFSGTYKDTLVNTQGCDSIITLIVTIYKPTSSTHFKTSACVDTFTFNGRTYSQSGTYRDTLINSKGCDSIITLHLTIRQPTIITNNAAACGYYFYNGKTFTTDTIYRDSFVNSQGCDSIVVLNLKINRLTTSYHFVTICADSSYTFNGKTYSSTGNYSSKANVPNAYGCDSMLMLILTVNPLPNPLITQLGDTLFTNSFSTYQWFRNNVKINGANAQKYIVHSSGDYSVSVSNNNNCTNTSAPLNVIFTGFTEPQNIKRGIRAFPNPAKDEITIEGLLQHTAELTDITGKTLFHIHKDGTYKLDMLEAGVYFIVSDNQVVKIVKI